MEYIERHLNSVMENMDLEKPTKEDLNKIKIEVIYILSHSTLHRSKLLNQALKLLTKNGVNIL